MSWWSDTWHGFTGRTQRKAAEAQVRALQQQERVLREQQRRTENERLRARSEEEFAIKGIRRRYQQFRKRGQARQAVTGRAQATGSAATPNL